jgi:hypothetical protein
MLLLLSALRAARAAKLSMHLFIKFLCLANFETLHSLRWRIRLFSSAFHAALDYHAVRDFAFSSCEDVRELNPLGLFKRQMLFH